MMRDEMNEQQVAAYLHMDLREVVKLASRGQIPCRKVAGRFRFRPGQIEQWVASHLGRLDKARLAGIEKGVSRHYGIDHEDLLVWPLIPEGGLAVPLPAKTRDSAIRELVNLAGAAELVYVPDELLAEIRKREQLCSTALIPHVALPHPRRPLPYDIAASFVVVGLTGAGVPYGAPDGSLTRLFFLICCKNERTHLHVLARICRILQAGPTVERILAADNAEHLADILLKAEQAIVKATG